jgi:hypothetical protein
MGDDHPADEPRDETPVPQWAFQDANNQLVTMIHDLSRKMAAEAADRKTALALLGTSIQNVQTQLLEKQGRFDFNKSFDASSSGAPSPQPAHKLCFPKFDGSGDPLVWLHKAEQFFCAYDTPPTM